jgi:glycosyltransferase involved in cell wall biosynthesis
VRYLGPVPAADRAATLGRAHALLHLIDFDEPFGYSVVEAMACGTPVVAYDRGSMSELLEHGSTGFVVGGLDEAVDAVGRAGDLDRRAIRASAVARFGVARMIDQYVAVYRSILSLG